MVTSSPRKTVFPVAAIALLAPMLGCDPQSVQPVVGLQAHSFAHSEWSAPVNLGPVVNSPFSDIAATLSPDGLSLYFVSNRPGGVGPSGNDIWVSRRASENGPWETPVNLTVINSDRDDGGPSLSGDGHLLFFNSGRAGGHGAADLYVSRRANPKDDFGWELPVNLGQLVNTAGGERAPDYFVGADDGPATLYFNQGNIALFGADLYAVPVTRNGEPLGTPELLSDLSTPGANDAGQSVCTDGREIFFWSDRAGTLGDADIWVSTRRGPHDAWSEPLNIGSVINTEFAEERPSLSHDGRTLLFDSLRPGGVNDSQDIWVSTRTSSGR
jgi:WD40-like Beta Propeller Repeat